MKKLCLLFLIFFCKSNLVISQCISLDELFLLTKKSTLNAHEYLLPLGYKLCGDATININRRTWQANKNGIYIVLAIEQFSDTNLVFNLDYRIKDSKECISKLLNEIEFYKLKKKSEVEHDLSISTFYEYLDFKLELMKWYNFESNEPWYRLKIFPK